MHTFLLCREVGRILPRFPYQIVSNNILQGFFASPPPPPRAVDVGLT